MSELFDLSGKTALVTGAGSGLGRQFAQTLADAGAAVVLAARRQEKLAETAGFIEAAGGKAVAISLDVNDTAAIPAAFDAAEEALGSVDVLVNNAGVSGVGLFHETDSDTWDHVLNTNLKSVWAVSREMVRRAMAAKRPVSIINIASILATGTNPGLGPYAASKAGVLHMTKAMAQEWGAEGIRINAISPGYFPSEMTDGYFDSPEGREMQQRIPMRRVGRTEELAGPLLLLASDASSYMNGSELVVDGGHLCRML